MILAHIHPVFEDFTALEWSIVVVAGVTTLWSLVMAVRYTLNPGEDDPAHPKRMILEGPATGGTTIDVEPAVPTSPAAGKGAAGRSAE